MERILNPIFGAMDDDLNTAAGLGLIFDKVKGINRLLDKSPNSNKIKAKLSKERNDLLSCANILGLLEETPAKFLENILRGDSDIKRMKLRN